MRAVDQVTSQKPGGGAMMEMAMTKQTSLTILYKSE